MVTVMSAGLPAKRAIDHARIGGRQLLRLVATLA
jgi:hypothetical protein